MCEYYPEYMKNNRLQTQPYRWTAKDLDATFMQKLTDAEENAMLKRCASCEATELEAKLYSCLGCKHGECALSYYCVCVFLPELLFCLRFVSRVENVKRMTGVFTS